jgi:hypothetical protein
MQRTAHRKRRRSPKFSSRKIRVLSCNRMAREQTQLRRTRRAIHLEKDAMICRRRTAGLPTVAIPFVDKAWKASATEAAGRLFLAARLMLALAKLRRGRRRVPAAASHGFRRFSSLGDGYLLTRRSALRMLERKCLDRQSPEHRKAAGAGSWATPMEPRWQRSLRRRGPLAGSAFTPARVFPSTRPRLLRAC